MSKTGRILPVHHARIELAKDTAHFRRVLAEVCDWVPCIGGTTLDEVGGSCRTPTGAPPAPYRSQPWPS